MAKRVASVPDRRPPWEEADRTDQVLEVLRELRDRDAEAGGGSGPRIGEAIREFSRKAERLHGERVGRDLPADVAPRGADGRCA